MSAAKLDPRTKLVIVLAISSLAVFIPDFQFLLGLTIFSWMAARLLGANPGGLVGRLRRLAWIFLPIVLLQSVFARAAGEPLVEIFGLAILTRGGLLMGLSMILRVMVIIVAASIMSTANSRDIVQGLVQWRLPSEIAFMVSLAMRFLPMLTEEVQDALTALQLRGVAPNKLPLGSRFRLYSYLLMPIIVGTIIRAEQLSLAMETRGFRAYPQRTSYRGLKLGWPDYVLMATAIGLSTLIMALYFI